MSLRKIPYILKCRCDFRTLATSTNLGPDPTLKTINGTQPRSVSFPASKRSSRSTIPELNSPSVNGVRLPTPISLVVSSLLMCSDCSVNTVSILLLTGRLPMNLGLLVLLTGCTEGKSRQQTQMASLVNHTNFAVLIDMERYSPVPQLKLTLPHRTRTPKVSTPEHRMASYPSSSSTRTQIPRSRSISRTSRLVLTSFVTSVARQASPSGRYELFHSAYMKHRLYTDPPGFLDDHFS